MFPSRSGIDAKFRRAGEHAAAMTRMVVDWNATDPVQFEGTLQDDGTIDLVARVSTPVPADLSLLFGDAVHNARSALDHLAWQLVIEGGGVPNRDTAFPITDSEEKFGDRLKKSLRGASPQARAAVQELRPWRGGDRELWQLHQLDVGDKHKVLIDPLPRMFGMEFGVVLPSPEPGADPVVMPPVLTALREPRPIKDGEPIGKADPSIRASSGVFRSDGRAYHYGIGLESKDIVDAAEADLPQFLIRLIDHAIAVADPFMRGW